MRRRRAAALARATGEVERQTRRGGSLSLMGLIEQYLAKRASHSAAIAAIDGELSRVYDRLSGDRPAAVAAAPAPADTPRQIPRPKVSPPVLALQVPPELASRKSDAEVGQACLDAVLRALASGASRTREIRDAVPEHPEQRVKHTLQNLVSRGIVVRSGHTHSTSYAFAPGQRPKPGPPVSTPPRDPRSVVADGQEYVTFWKPGRDAKSLIGDRETRADR